MEKLTQRQVELVHKWCCFSLLSFFPFCLVCLPPGVCPCDQVWSRWYLILCASKLHMCQCHVNRLDSIVIFELGRGHSKGSDPTEFLFVLSLIEQLNLPQPSLVWWFIEHAHINTHTHTHFFSFFFLKFRGFLAYLSYFEYFCLQKSTCRFNDRQGFFTLIKKDQSASYWPRLTKEQKKVKYYCFAFISQICFHCGQI